GNPGHKKTTQETQVSTIIHGRGKYDKGQPQRTTPRPRIRGRGPDRRRRAGPVRLVLLQERPGHYVRRRDVLQGEDAAAEGPPRRRLQRGRAPVHPPVHDRGRGQGRGRGRPGVPPRPGAALGEAANGDGNPPAAGQGRAAGGVARTTRRLLRGRPDGRRVRQRQGQAAGVQQRPRHPRVHGGDRLLAVRPVLPGDAGGEGGNGPGDGPAARRRHRGDPLFRHRQLPPFQERDGAGHVRPPPPRRLRLPGRGESPQVEGRAGGVPEDAFRVRRLRGDFLWREQGRQQGRGGPAAGRTPHPRRGRVGQERRRPGQGQVRRQAPVLPDRT